MALELGARCEILPFAGIAHFRNDDSARTGRQFLKAAADRRQRRLIADEEIPVEIVGHDERAARTADAEEMTRSSLRGPRCRRSIAVQHEVDGERIGGGIVVARRVIARCRPRHSFRINRSIGSERRHRRLFLARRREEQLDVIVVGGADKSGQIVAADHDAQHFWRERAHVTHLQHAPFGFMADTSRNAVRRLLGLRHVEDLSTLNVSTIPATARGLYEPGRSSPNRIDNSTSSANETDR